MISLLLFVYQHLFLAKILGCTASDAVALKYKLKLERAHKYIKDVYILGSFSEIHRVRRK